MKIFVSLLANLSRPFSVEAEFNQAPEAWPPCATRPPEAVFV
jgi:hypothetical protein